jgi:hypothetical protein
LLLWKMADPPAASRPPSRRPRLSDALSDELRQSVHRFEITREERSGLNQRPRLSHAFADELRKSVHKLETVKANNYKALQRPKLSGAFTDELRKSVHDRQNKVQKKGFFGRPKLSDVFADELRQSVHNLQENASKKKGGGLFGGFFGRRKETSYNDAQSIPRPFMSPVKEQKTPSTSRRGKLSLSIDDVEPVNLSPPAEQVEKSSERARRKVIVKSPVRSPRTPSRVERGDMDASTMAAAVRQNTHESTTKNTSNGVRRSVEQRNHITQSTNENYGNQPTIQTIKHGKAPEMDESLASYASFCAEAAPSNIYKPLKSVASSTNRKEKRQRSHKNLTSHSTSFHDDTSYLETRSAVSDLFSPVAGRRSVISTNSRSNNRSCLDEESNSLDGGDFDPDLLADTNGDIDAYRKEWIRLIKEKRSLKSKLATSRARNTLLAQQVDDLNAETEDLKSKLERSKETTSRLMEQHRSERIRFDNSSELVTRTRVELTKTTNENSKLKQQNFDLETAITSKDRLVADLNDTITRQADIIHKLSNKLKDQETTLRLSDDEKRRLEDEVAVLIAQKDGDELRDTFRQLEEEREKFFWQREMDIEAKRIELEKQRDWILEQDKVRHAKDMERLAHDTSREVEMERERNAIQDLINQQLEDMKVTNRELRDKFARERSEIMGELKEKENYILQLEREILELQKQLSAQNRSKKDIALSKADAKSAKDDLRDMQRHRLILEKEISKLKKKVKKGSTDPDGWREIIFPGYRGVSFGSEDSAALAGFLTILVEEKGKKSRKAKKATIELEKILEERERKHGTQKKKGARKSRSKKKVRSTSNPKASESRHKNKGMSSPSRKNTKSKGEKGKVQSHKSKIRSKVKPSKREDRGRELKRKNGGKRKSSSKRKQRISRSSDSIYIGNNMTLDQNLELMLRDTMGDGSDIDIDDTSMLVFKRNHHCSPSKGRRSVSHGPSGRLSSRGRSSFDHHHRRRSRSNPPPEIVLQ